MSDAAIQAAEIWNTEWPSSLEEKETENWTLCMSNEKNGSQLFGEEEVVTSVQQGYKAEKKIFVECPSCIEGLTL